MSSNIIMPKLGMNMKEGTVIEWLRHESEEVKRGEPIAVISSDKIEKEIESPEDGYLLHINAKENEVVPIGTTIAVIGLEMENSGFTREEMPIMMESKKSHEKIVNRLASSLPLPNNYIKKKILISPSARHLAESLGIDIEKIQGTGPNGRITNNDIRKAAQKMGKPLNFENNSGQESGFASDKEKKTNNTKPDLESNIEPLVGMRRTIADRLFGSLHNTAQLTITMKVDITEMQRVRKSLNKNCEENSMDVHFTITDFIAKAAIMALQMHPIMNSTLVNNEIHYNKEIHLGLAVALKSGLIVPVIRNAEKLRFRQLSETIHSLGKKARNNELDLKEIIGSTFSITNLGMSGVEYFTPVLNPPETGILGLGSVFRAAEVDEEGRVVSKEFLPLSLTFDHRVTDGKPASEFLAKIKDFMKDPLLLLI